MGKLTIGFLKLISKPGRYNDGDGLFLDWRAPGKGNWYLRFSMYGKRRELNLGQFELFTLKEAREMAFEARKNIQRGIDPIAERQKQRVEALNFRAAAQRFHTEQKATWKSAKHQEQWLTMLERHVFPKMGVQLVKNIGIPSIREVLLPIWLSKPETSRKLKQQIGAVLDWAYANGMRETEAPMRSLMRALPKKTASENHFSAMPYPDLPKFFRHLHERESVPRLALEFLILTAARSGEIRGAKWAEIDLEQMTWTVPAARMKMNKTHIVPLNAATVDVLNRAKPHYAVCSDLVFPGRNVLRPMSDMTLLKILRYAELPYTVHGFRSAFRDWVAEQTNTPGEIAEAALAHSVANKVEAAYRRTSYLDKRRPLMVQWADFCLSK